MYIQPYIELCNIVWGRSSESNKLKSFRLQKRACKVILDYNVNDSFDAMDSLKFSYAVLSVCYSFTIISMGRREVVDLQWCHSISWSY